MAKLAIKSDNRKQNLLLPPSLDELVPQNHMVRVVDAAYKIFGSSSILLHQFIKTPIVVYRQNDDPRVLTYCREAPRFVE